MTKAFQFEQSISSLEEIVRQLEKGDLTLEESLKQFEKGIALARNCQEILNKAEQKIQQLTLSQTPHEINLDANESD